MKIFKKIMLLGVIFVAIPLCAMEHEYPWMKKSEEVPQTPATPNTPNIFSTYNLPYNMIPQTPAQNVEQQAELVDQVLETNDEQIDEELSKSVENTQRKKRQKTAQYPYKKLDDGSYECLLCDVVKQGINSEPIRRHIKMVHTEQFKSWKKQERNTKCDQCNAPEFDFPSQLKAHKQTKHGEGFKCREKLCNRSCWTQAGRLKHEKQPHYECPFCHNRFVASERHQELCGKRKHAEEEIETESNKNPRETVPSQSIEISNDTNDTASDVPLLTFFSGITEEVPVNKPEEQPVEQLLQPEASVALNSTEEIPASKKRKRKTGDAEKVEKFACKSRECKAKDIAFSSPLELQEHKVKEHIEKCVGYSANYCTEEGCYEVCISKSALEKHMRTHTGEKPFHCEKCNLWFSTQAILTNHSKTKKHFEQMKIHHGGRNESLQ